MNTGMSQDCLDQLMLEAHSVNVFVDRPVPMELLRKAYDNAKMDEQNKALN